MNFKNKFSSKPAQTFVRQSNDGTTVYVGDKRSPEKLAVYHCLMLESLAVDFASLYWRRQGELGEPELAIELATNATDIAAYAREFYDLWVKNQWDGIEDYKRELKAFFESKIANGEVPNGSISG